MIIPRNLETRKFLEHLRRQDQRLKQERRRAKKDHTALRLARVVYGVDGSVTRIWRND